MSSEKKELIRQAAIKVISREGFYNATTDQIAVEAGISVGTIYNYFNNKADILGYIFQVEMDKRIKFWENVQSETSVLDKLKSYFKFHFEEIYRDVDLACILLREHNFPSKHIIIPVKEFKKKIIDHLKTVLKEGIDRGEVKPFKNLTVISATILGALQGASEQFIKFLEEGQTTSTPEEIALELTEMIWESVANK